MAKTDFRTSADISLARIDGPDLTANAVYQHFASSRQGSYLAYLLAMDRADHWAVDHDEHASQGAFDVQLYLLEVAQLVSTCAPILHRVPREFAAVLAHLTTTRCLYLIRYAAQQNEQFLECLVSLLDSDDGASPELAIIRQRLDASSKARLLGDIFSGNRLNRIASIMGSYTDE